MKIKLKALGLISTKGYYIDLIDRALSSTTFKDINSSILLSEIYFQDSTGVIAGERLGTQHTVWIPARLFNSAIEPIRGTRLTLSLQTQNLNLQIKSILWQISNTIRITLQDNVNLPQSLVNDYIQIISAANSENNGIFQIIGIGKAGNDIYADVINNSRNGNTKDESINVVAMIQKNYRTFEISDLKNGIHSNFEDHYELNIYHRND